MAKPFRTSKNIDQMLEILAGKSHYYFLDVYNSYNQIVIALEDKENIIFTCPFGIFIYKRMCFGLCNAPTTFQICIMSLILDYVKIIIKVFMDEFTIYGNFFYTCLMNLTIILK
jgi:hypothetical protein